MPSHNKLSLPTDQRMALLRNQTSYLLWHGKIETTIATAKEVRRMAEKIITAAINSYEDTVSVTKTKFMAAKKKGKNVSKEKVPTEVEVFNDGPKKLAARRRIMRKLYDIPEIPANDETPAQFKVRVKDIRHPLIEKVFNELAPKYKARAKELGQGGGYTRIVKLGQRRGDAAEMAIIELV